MRLLIVLTLLFGSLAFAEVKQSEKGRLIVSECDQTVEKILPKCADFDKKLRAGEFKTVTNLNSVANGCDLEKREKLFLVCTKTHQTK